MRLFLSCFLFLLISSVFSQEKADIEDTLKVKIDSLYREDQFYFSFTFNTLQKKPVGLTQDKFSSGFSIGFLRDMPVNKKRTVAIAPGLGFTYNNYNQNLAITKLNGTPVYTIIDANTAYSKNKFSQLSVDVPIEFRWRSSTYESHKFWRIYGGFKMSYLIYDKSVYQDSEEKVVVSNNSDFNKFQYGMYLASGYNTINVYAYYGLKSLFQSARTSTMESINMNSLNVGIMFYIL
ncbi:MAG: porin family protein [Bacteroidota bacterium]